MTAPVDPAGLGPGVASGERFASRDDILERSARAAAAFAEAGVGPGDTVALVLRNDIAFFEATLAAGALGSYAVPVNWHYRADEAGYILGNSAAKVVVAHADLIPQIAAAVPQDATLVGVTTPPELADAYNTPADRCRPPGGTLEWETWVGAHPPLQRRHQAPPSMIYTSGTTGRPKGVRRAPYRAENLPSLAELSRQVLGIEAGMRTVIPAPLYHTAPNTYALAALLAGGTVALQARFDPVGLVELIGRFAITHLQVVPTMFVRLLQLSDTQRAAAKVSSLRHVVHAAAPCPPGVKAAMIDWWGPIITEYYGCTESGIITACTSQQWLAHPGSVGRPVTGAEVKILDADRQALAWDTRGALGSQPGVRPLRLLPRQHGPRRRP